MAFRTIVMDRHGRLTLPPETRRELGLDGEVTLTVAIDPTGGIVLHPVWASDDDAWVYTPEHREAVARALRDAEAGRTRRMSEEELLRLAGLTDADA